MSKIIHIFMGIWFLFYVFNSVIRFYLTHYGVPYLIYVPNIILTLIVLAYLIKVIRTLRVQKHIFIILLIILISTIIGLINQLDVGQVLFAINIFLPFLGAFIYFYYYKPKDIVLINLYRIFTPIILVGLFLDNSFILPWQGLEYEFGNYLIEGNRYWTTVGIERLSGFQRSSIDSGVLLFVLLIINLLVRLLSNIKFNVFLKIYDFILYLLGIYGIYLTTFKTAYLSIISVSMLWILLIIYKNTNWKKGKVLCGIMIKSQIFLLFIYSSFPPIISLFGINILSFINNQNSDFFRFVFASYVERMEWMWPNAFKLLKSSYFPILGRGAGGIGVPQRYFEDSLYNAADNFFVYIFVSFGALSLIAIVYFVIKIFMLDMDKNYNLFLLFSFLIIFSFGGTINIVESNGLMVILSMFLSNYTKMKIINTHPCLSNCNP